MKSMSMGQERIALWERVLECVKFEDHSGMQMYEHVEYSGSETFSLTPRPVAVKKRGNYPKLLKQFSALADVISIRYASLTTIRRIKERRMETVKTVICHQGVVLHRDGSRC